ncbi:MAG: hypothetical protein J6K49_08835 [Clostridia bacterium]|nr:hypothetical protein [Clostridia bacterium]
MLDAEMLEESYLYKRMYLYLFNRITDALEYKTIEEIKESLMKAQCETEDIYIEKEAEIPEIEILRTINENETNIGLLELLIETEKEKPVEMREESFLEEITDWKKELEENNEYLKSIQTKKTMAQKVCESILTGEQKIK